MNGRAALLTVIALASACSGRGDEQREPRAAVREPADLDGLRAMLARARDTIAGAREPRRAAAAIVDSWQVPARAWPALVTEHFRPHHDAYVHAYAATRERLVEELVAAIGAPAGGATARPLELRWQYADDPALTGEQVRLRVALPVGHPGAIALVDGRPLSPIFAHDGERWRALAGLDDLVVRYLALPLTACIAPYRAATREPCLAMTAPVIAAALDEDAVGLERACARLRLHCPR